MSRGRAGEKVGCAYALTWLLTFRPPVRGIPVNQPRLGRGQSTPRR